jgi:hypothetical protein
MRFSGRRSSTVRLATLAAALAAVVGCGGDSSSSGPSDETEVASFLSQVATSDLQTTAALREGERPGTQGAAGATLTVANTAAAILGGNTPVALQASSAFNKVIVAIDGETGYYELTLPAAVTSTQVVISLPQELPRPTFNVVYGVADAAGAVAAYESTPVSVQTVGTGDVQVTISWDAESDVDLHVIDPSGEEIFYGNPTSQSGGELDLDSNAACRIDGVKNENITFPAGRAPRGEYIVKVDYWSNCDVPVTKFFGTVRVVGRPPQPFTGELTGEGDEGAEGSGTEVARFTY